MVRAGQAAAGPAHFPITDSFRTGDDDLGAIEDALAAAKRCALHESMGPHSLSGAAGEAALP